MIPDKDEPLVVTRRTAQLRSTGQPREHHGDEWVMRQEMALDVLVTKEEIDKLLDPKGDLEGRQPHQLYYSDEGDLLFPQLNDIGAKVRSGMVGSMSVQGASQTRYEFYCETVGQANALVLLPGAQANLSLRLRFDPLSDEEMDYYQFAESVLQAETVSFECRLLAGNEEIPAKADENQGELPV